MRDNVHLGLANAIKSFKLMENAKIVNQVINLHPIEKVVNQALQNVQIARQTTVQIVVQDNIRCNLEDVLIVVSIKFLQKMDTHVNSQHV